MGNDLQLRLVMQLGAAMIMGTLLLGAIAFAPLMS